MLLCPTQDTARVLNLGTMSTGKTPKLASPIYSGGILRGITEKVLVMD